MFSLAEMVNNSDWFLSGNQNRFFESQPYQDQQFLRRETTESRQQSAPAKKEIKEILGTNKNS